MSCSWARVSTPSNTLPSCHTPPTTNRHDLHTTRHRSLSLSLPLSSLFVVSLSLLFSLPLSPHRHTRAKRVARITGSIVRGLKQLAHIANSYSTHTQHTIQCHHNFTGTTHSTTKMQGSVSPGQSQCSLNNETPDHIRFTHT